MAEWLRIATDAVRVSNEQRMRPEVNSSPTQRSIDAPQCSVLSSAAIDSASSQMLLLYLERAERLQALIPTLEAMGGSVDPSCYQVAAQVEMLRLIIPEKIEIEKVEIQMKALRGGR